MANFKHIKTFNENSDLSNMGDKYKEWMDKRANLLNDPTKKYNRELENDENILLHAVLNEIESDFDNQDYDSIDELLTLLIKVPEAKAFLIGYLSDDAKEYWIQGTTEKRYE